MSYEDDPSINAESLLVRYINPEYHMVELENGQSRLSSAAFSPASRDGGLSVDVDPPQDFVQLKSLTAPHGGSVSMKACAVRDAGLMIQRAPLPSNQYHANIWGLGNNKRLKNHLKDISVWVVRHN